MEPKLTKARKVKEVRGQGIDWIIFMGFGVSNNDGRKGSGEGVSNPGAEVIHEREGVTKKLVE